MTSHGVVHFEIPSEDPDKLAQFYAQLFGWQIDKMPVPGMGYFAQLMDPEGNPFGVWEGNSEAA